MTATAQRSEPTTRRPLPWFVDFYRTDLGKKWAMAITGAVLLGYVLVHLLGNLKAYIGPSSIDLYGEALRDLGGHLVPRTHLLWIMRIGLGFAFVIHVHAAYALTFRNFRARGSQRYEAGRHYLSANPASRTMRWTGSIVLAYLVFHLADLTWGSANPDFMRGHPYANLVASLQRPAVAVLYVIANFALAVHIYHGAWSMFQSAGMNNARFNRWRRGFAIGFAALVLIGNLSIPIAIQLGIIG